MTTNINDLSIEERKLLLFLETCAVDKSGAIDTRHLNHEDYATMHRWAQEGFVESGRIGAEDKTRWVRLSDAAWELVAQARKERAQRKWSNRRFKTTQDLHAQLS